MGWKDEGEDSVTAGGPRWDWERRRGRKGRAGRRGEKADSGVNMKNSAVGKRVRKSRDGGAHAQLHHWGGRSSHICTRSRPT